jgi:predicted NodU family carbamoyl transferase
MKLLLTLGHNSSAILVDDEKVLCGYEEERLSHVKSDSSFPILAITKILEYFPEARFETNEVCVSHWFWHEELPESKYFKPKYLAANFPNAIVTSISDEVTHHDLHAKSMWNFCDGDNSGLTIVADGFGNFGECLSIYNEGSLLHRSYDVDHSLGLMYQYAVGYLDMKENQDEYKLLGYEQQANSKYKVDVESTIEEVVHKVFDGLMSMSYKKYDMTTSLCHTRAQWYSTFTYVTNDTKDRAKVAYFVQTVLERVMLRVLQKYNIKNVKVSGGVFYNVKLNNMILRWSDQFEANPLAGDQGCALGFTNVRYNHLFWGLRDVSNFLNSPYTDISDKGYTEILTGSMEFGPRALCHTSTLALPKMSLVEKINAMNGRDTVMPMAPIVSMEFAKKNFLDLHKVNKSKYFMIIAFDCSNDSKVTEFLGATHIDSDRGVYTCRIHVAS